MIECQDSPDGLSDEQKEQIRAILEKVAQIGAKPLDFVDPKFYGLLTIAFDILDEQILGDRIYLLDSRERTSEDNFVTSDDDIPSVEELEEMLKVEGKKRD